MKKFILIGLITCLAINIQAQDDGFYGPTPKSNTKELKKMNRQKKLERWSFGGNFWLSLGTNAYIEASPIAMYKLTPKLMMGPGYTFIYYKYSNPYYESNIHGPRAIIDYTLFSDLQEKISINLGNIILHGEYEYLNTDEIDTYGYLTDSRVWVSNLLIGGGIYQPIGNRGGLSIIVLYNFFENKNSAYIQSNPVIRFGFYF